MNSAGSDSTPVTQDPVRSAIQAQAQGAANSETPAPYPREDEPMQLGRTRLTPEEREKRMRERRCYYCGGFGHFSATCSAKARARQ
uniref:CCHC-type domain-containing protein n=1 Tax=Knipowitschia caucasica TaxID=637954 RepID=A0AAV2IV15_KNICA